MFSKYFIPFFVLLPLVFDLMGIKSIYTMAALLISVAVLTVDLVIKSFKSKNVLIPRLKFIIPGALMAVFTLLSLGFSKYGAFLLGEAQLYSTSVIALISCGFIFYYISCLSLSARKELIKALLFLAVLTSFALVAAVFVPGLSVPFRLLFFAIVAFWLYVISFDRSADIFSHEKARGALNWVLFLGYGIAVLSLGNLIGIILAAAGAAVAYFALKDYSKALNDSEQRVLIGAGIVLLFSFVLWVLTISTGIRFSFFSDIATSLIVPSMSLSVDVFAGALNFKTFFIGNGLGSFSHLFLLNVPETFAQSAVWDIQFARATNGFLHFFTELGLLFILSFVALIAMVLSSALKSLKHRYDSMQFLSISGLVLSLILLVLLPVSFSTLLLTTIFAGVLTHSRKVQIGNSLVLRVIASTLVLFIFAMSVYSLFAISERLKLSRLLSSTSDAPTVENLVTASKAVSNALGYDAGYRMMAQYINDFIIFNRNVLSNEDLTRYLQAQEFAALEGLKINEASVYNWAIVADTYRYLSSYDRGLLGPMNIAYGNAVELAPARPDLYVKQARGLMLESSYEDTETEEGVVRERELLDRAKEKIDRAIELRPSYGPAYSLLALYYERIGDLSEALNTLEELQFNNPDSPELMYDIGMLNLRLGRSEIAATAFERAIDIFPAYTNAYWYLSVAYEEAGSVGASIEVLEEMVAQGFVDKRILQRLKRLREGGEAPEELPAPLGSTEELGLDPAASGEVDLSTE